jgi:hypothetical protein
MAGCAGASPSVQAAAGGGPTMTESDGGVPPRRPDGVVLEPPPALPSPAGTAEARGVVALREPYSDAAVVHLVEALLDAWQRESLDALLALLTPDAEGLDTHAHGRSALADAWRQRMQAHEYGRLSGRELVRPERIRHWAYEDLGGKGAPARPTEMKAGDLYVRAPLEVTHAAGERLFSDVIVLILRPDQNKLRIAAYGESDL